MNVSTSGRSDAFRAERGDVDLRNLRDQPARRRAVVDAAAEARGLLLAEEGERLLLLDDGALAAAGESRATREWIGGCDGVGESWEGIARRRVGWSSCV